MGSRQHRVTLPSLDIFSPQDLVQYLPKSKAREILDAKERELRAVITAIRSLRNTLIPIDVLPNEILGEIFYLLLWDDPGPSRVGIRSLVSLNVGQVCQRWRRVALGMPTLWSRIDGRNLRIAKECITRSRASPLEIFLNHDMNFSPRARDFMSLIVPVFRRIQRLELSLHHYGFNSIVPFLNVGLPALEAICFHQTSGRRVLRLDQSFRLPANIMGAHTPLLTQLYLEHVSLPFTSPLYSNLKIMEIYRQHPLDIPSMAVFLDVLDKCPNLERLSLIEAGPESGRSLRDTPERCVSLPQLRRLNLNNGPEPSVLILSHLKLPSTCDLVISCDLESSDNDLSAVLPPDLKSLGMFSEISRISINLEDMMAINVEGRNTSGSTISINLMIDDGMLKPRLFLSQLGTFLPLCHLEQLQIINCASHIAQEKWREVLSNLPTLECLVLKETSDLVTYGRLMKALKMSPLGSEDGVLCPKLKCLRLFGLDCEMWAVLLDVWDCCKYRKLKSAPLEKLQIAGLRPASDIIPELRSIIPTVDTTSKDVLCP